MHASTPRTLRCAQRETCRGDGTISSEENSPEESYTADLKEYIGARSEGALYQASLLGQIFVEQGLGPDDIIALHSEALDAVTSSLTYRQRASAATDGLQFLLEVMIAYGVHHQRYLALRLAERTRLADEQAARDRQRVAEAERIAREKSEILAAIAHELNTPITAASGSLQLAARALDLGRFDRVAQRVAIAGDAIERLSRLSAELTRASRDEVVLLEIAPQSLGEIVAQTSNWLLGEARNKQITIDFPAADAGPTVLADANALQTIVSNLLSNAIRYTPKGGHITLSYGIVDGYGFLRVQDTGMGMTPEIKARIFDKFYRAPEAKRVSSQGFGLGLALVQQFVGAQEGTISVESAPDAGSTFEVRLPLAVKEESERG
jgi:signal transduction histidine kinase